MPKRVAVLGAGASGLIAIKSCLDEGLEPVCLEKGTDIGGLWKYHDDVRDGHGSVFSTTVINTRQEDFQGRIVHTHDYKKSKGYEDKRIMVIGIGNSGADAAVELARVGSQVFLSTRRGSWVISRVGENGVPIDLFGIRRIFDFVPISWKASFAERVLNQRFNHANYGLLPKHGVLQQHPTVNDGLPNEILSGRVKVKANVKRFLKTCVEFEDGTVEEDIDEVVMATGYTFGFQFVDESIVKVTNNEVTMYKYVFPPHMKHGTLAVIGLVQAPGAHNPISELQCRWATRVFKGLAKLPSQETMMTDIKNKKEAMASRYVKSQRHTIQVDYIPYMDEIAEMIGVRPNFYKLFLTDPKLAFKCFFGPTLPYQYRFMGPGKWAGAKEAIETLWYRVIYATKTRPVDEPLNKSGLGGFLKLLVLLTVILTLIMKFL
ncbi:flavin-containing monooxygenase 5-like isoform X2 [Ptychodera flava]|uniref:flavin-containing monooxygenase 5-like isoform X2 n=1 Tax=Ptychodera flava TaxID=63121 RepID=UPI003969ECF5